MPVYNGERYIREALKSVLEQTYSDFECLVIDDGSTDSSIEIIKSFVDPRIRYVSKNHSGITDTLNVGIKESRGEYIARFDCDDICEVSRFKEQMDFFNSHPDCSMVGSYAYLIDEDGVLSGKVLDYPQTNEKAIRRYALFHNPFIHPTVMIKKSCLEKTDGYRACFKHVEDYELWTRIIFKNGCANIPKPLIRYRIHKNQVTRRNNLVMRFWGLSVRVLAFFRYASSF